ncbi:MAG: enoyl-CoA hydratase/isomerase family protein [Vulcanimicrobiota bacterium]
MLELKITDDVAYITFNRPEKLNTFKVKHMHELKEMLKGLNRKKNLLFLVFQGRGKVFSAGFDISDFMPSIDRKEPFYEVFPDLLRYIRNIKCPTLAVLHGSAYGFGCGLAVSCDFRIAKKGGVLAIPISKLGFNYSPNEILSLTHKMGIPIIKELLLAGRPLSFERAYNLGVINHLLESDQELEIEINNYIEDNRKLAPMAVKFGKKAINHLVQNLVAREDEAYELFYELFDTKDFVEGQKAFLEKRKPFFRGE